MRLSAVSVFVMAVLFTASLVVAQSTSAIGGYCPVAYAAMNKAVKGDPAFSSVHNGQRFQFVNAGAKKMFDAEPRRYSPRFEGWCATAVAQGMKVESQPTLFTVHEGKTYLFSSQEAKAMFDQDTAGTITKADANWPGVSKMKPSKM